MKRKGLVSPLVRGVVGLSESVWLVGFEECLGSSIEVEPSGLLSSSMFGTLLDIFGELHMLIVIIVVVIFLIAIITLHLDDGTILGVHLNLPQTVIVLDDDLVDQ